MLVIHDTGGKSSDSRSGGICRRRDDPSLPTYQVCSGSLSAHIFDASGVPHAYSAGYAGLFTPFRLRPALTYGLYGPDDLSRLDSIVRVPTIIFDPDTHLNYKYNKSTVEVNIPPPFVERHLSNRS